MGARKPYIFQDLVAGGGGGGGALGTLSLSRPSHNLGDQGMLKNLALLSLTSGDVGEA